MDTRRLFVIKLHNMVQLYQQSPSTLLATRAAKWAACFPLAGADPKEQHVTIAFGHLREYVSARRCDVCVYFSPVCCQVGCCGASRQGGAASREQVTATCGKGRAHVIGKKFQQG